MKLSLRSRGAFALLILSFLWLDPRPALPQRMMMGARGGIDLGREHFDNAPDGITFSTHLGLTAGLQFDYWFGNTWALSGQALYDQKGGDAASSDGTGNKVRQYVNVLEIPILLKASFLTGSWRPYLFVGPSLGISLNGGTTSISPDAGYEVTVKMPDSVISRFDVSLVAGAGLAYTLPSEIQLFLDAAYSTGFVNIDISANGGKTPLHLRDVRIMAGAMFPLN